VMCWNFDEEKISRAAVFNTDCSRDKSVPVGAYKK